jgi:hypothetical protein
VVNNNGGTFGFLNQRDRSANKTLNTLGGSANQDGPQETNKDQLDADELSFSCSPIPQARRK